ncbi:MAG: hypothetical protein LBK70_01430 [Clostridiales bacterium]|jgi:hypothetical protein|nr:hypothetical protein [Clostridiales bacterium]
MNAIKIKNWSLPKVVDGLFANLAIFAISWVWARSNKSSLIVATYIACLSTLCVWAIFKLRSNTKRVDSLNRAQLSHMQECINQLMLNLPQDNLDFFNKILSKKFDTVTQYEDCLIVRHNGVSTSVFVNINPGKITETEICKCFARSNNMSLDKMLILTANGLTPSGKQLISHLPNINTTIYNDVDVYKMLMAFGTYPDIQVKLKKATKISKLNIITIALNPKNAKKYLILSFVFVIYSYFFGNPVYYLIFASIALTLALFSKFNLRT